MAAKKMNAVFLMFIVVAATIVQFTNADDKVEAEEAKFTEKFKSCYETCEKECIDQGNGVSYCEVKCDEDCDEKEVADKLHIDPATN